MWFVFAILAAVFWGMSYVFLEQILKHISVPTALAVNMVVAALVVTLYALLSGSFKSDLSVITSSRYVLFLVIAGIAVSLAADFFIAFSVDAKNATLAGFIEISYPFFIVLFSFLFFKENHLTLGSALGGIFIFLGAFLVYFFGK
jgi:uncharacterized membrane protein